MINIGQYIEMAINWMMVHFFTFFDEAGVSSCEHDAPVSAVSSITVASNQPIWHNGQSALPLTEV